MERDDSYIQQQLHEAAVSENNAAQTKDSPFVIYRPRLTRDGDAWIACLGENIQEGVVGVGSSPHEASLAFNKAWYEKIKS